METKQSDGQFILPRHCQFRCAFKNALLASALAAVPVVSPLAALAEAVRQPVGAAAEADGSPAAEVSAAQASAVAHPEVVLPEVVLPEVVLPEAALSAVADRLPVADSAADNNPVPSTRDHNGHNGNTPNR
ncbi:hypothetical protein [Kaarinaea lacus]